MTIETKDAISEVIGAMLNALEKDEQLALEKFAEHPGMQRVCASIEGRKPDHFHLFMMYPLESAIGAMVRSVFADKVADKNDLSRVEFIFCHAEMIESHYEKLICQFDGWPCSADKSRTIIRALTRYFVEGKRIEFDRSDESAYWLPKNVFTTHDEIVELFHGIREFHYGNPSRYIKAFGAIVLNKASGQK